MISNSPINQHVLARASKDAAFRQALLSDPKAALAREFDVQVADSVTIRVLEDTPTTFTLVLPPQETAMRELSDAELEAAAGAAIIISMYGAECVTDYCDPTWWKGCGE
jgi:hypothetical protein